MLRSAAAARTRRRGYGAAAAVVAMLLLVAGACTDGGPGTTPPTLHPPVTLTWWIGTPDGQLQSLWQSVAADFEARHPYVTIEVSDHRGEALSGIPDLFPVVGGAWDLVGLVRAGAVMDITDVVSAEVGAIGGSAAGWRVNGRQYGLPYSTGVEGFWYRKSLFAQAGITSPPTTITELSDDADRLRATGIVPMVVDSVVGWPAAHYWQNLVVRECGTDTLEQSVVNLSFSDPCFVRAGTDLAALLAIDPFQPGWDRPGGPAESTTNPAELLVGGQAAMELADDRYPSVVSGLAHELGENADAAVSDLGWFPFPAVPGGRGNTAAQLGGGAGFACSSTAPPECVELLGYVVSARVQAQYTSVANALPANRDVGAGLALPMPLLDAVYGSDYVQLWLDTAYGPTVGQAMNGAVLQMFEGVGSAQQVVDAMNAAGRQPR